MFIHLDGDAHAVCHATCYHHDGHEAFMDAIFSPTWEDGVDDRTTFGCRVGPIEGVEGSGVSLVQAARAWPDGETFGRKLTRDEALQHPWLDDFWDVVDHVLENQPEVREHIYGPE